MIMTSSPIVVPHSHTPLVASPNSSPQLRPVASTMARSSSGTMTPLAMPSASCPIPSNIPNSSPNRSFARAPPIRPYQSPLCSRAGHVVGNNGKEITGDTKAFAQIVVGLVEQRARLGTLSEGVQVDNALPVPLTRQVKSVGSGSWDMERAELIVDIPVWSPGCFTDLSTLHQLRDTTLSHTHAILTHLLTNHSIPATYRLLARSGPSASPAAPHMTGWGCIRLAPPSPLTPQTAPSSLGISPNSRMHRRRTSFVKPERRLSTDLKLKLSHEHAIADLSDDDDDDVLGGRGGRPRVVQLKEGYGSGSGSDTEDDEESADVLVAREVEKRGAKEGDAFLMTLHGQPALILI